MNTEQCSECGSKMEYREELSTRGWFCTKCDWGFVTSNLPLTVTDQTIYEVHVTGGDHRNPAHMKAVAEVTGRNFLGARELLQQSEPLVFRGRALEVARVGTTLTAAGVGIRIVPPFPHSLSS